MAAAGKNTKTEAPAELRPGTTFALFRPKGERAYSAKIVLPNGYEEIYDTGKTAKMGAVGTANGRVSILCKEQGIEKPVRRRLVHPARDPLEQGPTPIEQDPEVDGDGDGDGDGNGNAKWKRHVWTEEQRYMIAFRRLEDMLLLRMDDDPQSFVDHARATVIQMRQSGVAKKPRAPYGSKSKGGRAV